MDGTKHLPRTSLKRYLAKTPAQRKLFAVPSGLSPGAQAREKKARPAPQQTKRSKRIDAKNTRTYPAKKKAEDTIYGTKKRKK